MFPPTTPKEDQSDQESDTTAEPQSEPEDFDDQRSVSVVSSVGIHDLEGHEAVTKDVPTVEVSETAETPFGMLWINDLTLKPHGVTKIKFFLSVSLLNQTLLLKKLLIF